MLPSHDTWNPAALPDQTGKRFVVTGGNAGLGYFAAEQLAAAGASVVLASRSPQKAQLALEAIRAAVPGARVSFVRLDLADLSTVPPAAEELRAEAIDGLVANAGILGARTRGETADGFELMFGTNHLGHAALIAELLPTLAATPDSRIVHLGSIAHRFERLDFADLQSEKYRSFRSYCRSKLAVMLFAFELDRRLREAGSGIRSLVAHPGYSVDELSPARAGVVPERPNPVIRTALGGFAQGKDAGAWPVARAMTDPAAAGGDYWGPGGWEQLRGAPALVTTKPHARDPETAARLWRATERLLDRAIDIPRSTAA
ncbi:oxidoreductase [Compostimonas suwonensis]|uniref:NADP-dependent 3-hydroxy acid dehydrogenase YdfG n=1 Tax=Compostimonas suwonensis TaxID=1048394 RepID=A0A2M9BWS6_9MICO|nr:oxidoreductase [Compostimonas suwonensis]PJJ62390.1 NADP-dependent 3-hydroxy acid dehydrogenase YdfG [Compostimonas suwonensis]